MFTKEFWKAALTRCLHTVAQTALATIGTTALIEKVNWMAVLSASALAGVISILKSITIGVPETETRVEYRYLDENGVPVDGHYMLVKNVEDEVCEECDLSKYLSEDSGAEDGEK